MTSSLESSNEELKYHFENLVRYAATPDAHTFLLDAIAAVEDRTTTAFRADPNARDIFVEQYIRDVLAELSKPSNSTALLDIAVELIEQLLTIEFTDKVAKFSRLCRSLLVVLQCGHERIARSAQRVLMLMIDADPSFSVEAHHSHSDGGGLHSSGSPAGASPSRLAHLLPKEARELCEMTDRDKGNRNEESRKRALATMLVNEALMKRAPQSVSAFRSQLVQLTIALCGNNNDSSVRNAAYSCLTAILSNHIGITAPESNLLKDSVKVLSATNNSEALVVGAMQCLRALFTCRGAASYDQAELSNLCTLVLEKHRATRSSIVRVTATALIAHIARFDPLFKNRRQAYISAVMDPLKNVRGDELNKVGELKNVAEYIRGVGYQGLDENSRVNLEPALEHYITKQATQSECCNVLAAMAKSLARTKKRRPSDRTTGNKIL